MKLNKLISVVCAALIALTTIIYSAVPAFASSDTTEETWVESTFDAIATALWNMTGAALKSSYDTFVDGLLAVGWYYDADIYALVDPTSDCMYGLTVDGVLVRERSGGSSGRGRRRVDSGDDVVVGTETFAEIIDRLNEQYGHNAVDRISVLNEKRWGYKSTDRYRKASLSFYQAGTFCNQSDWSEVYMVPFFYSATKDEYYYGLNQLHYTQSVETVDGVNHIYMDCSVTNYVDTSYSWNSRVQDESATATDFAVYRYADICSYMQSNSNNCSGGYLYKTYSNYVSLLKDSTGNYILRRDPNSSGVTSLYNYYSASALANEDFTSYIVGRDYYESCFSSLGSYVEGNDIGYFVSNEPIYLGLDWTGIDASKLDTESTIAFTGTTINEYTITNSSGDTNTINEYVTNNYTYITNNNGDDGDGDSSDSGSGTTSGNVVVGGNVLVDGAIDVGGQVDVNINVNENDDFVAPDTNLVENLPEEPTEFTDYLAILFAKLPVEVLGLILGGIAAAIFCRVWGR